MSKKQTDGPMSARRDKYIHKAMPVKAVFAVYLGEPRSDFSGEKGRLRSLPSCPFRRRAGRLLR